VHRGRAGPGNRDRGGLALGAQASDRGEFVRGLYAAWNDGGTGALDPFVTETLEWQDAPELPDAGTHTGRDAVLGRLSEFEVEGHILRIHAEVSEIREAGDLALVFLDGHATGGSSGAPVVEQKFIHLLHFAPDGRVDRAQAFFDPAAAEAAFAGQSGESAVR
jgi:ketosteroid isomerase-like protein